jgi:hypothetical protein
MASYRNLSDADLWSELALAQMVQKRYPPTSREWKEQSRKIHALARENKRRYGPKRRQKNPGGKVHTKKFDRCVSKVKKRRRGGKRARNAFAVCTRSLGKRAFRKKRRNPSRYKGRGEYVVTAQKKGGKLLRLVEGNKFAEAGRPMVFATQRSAALMARWLRKVYPVLRGYNPTATPR